MSGASTRRLKSTEVEPEMMVRVARAYYLQDKSKVDIASEEGLSRWQVARVLSEARSTGFVRIQVGDPARPNEELSEQLTEALGINRSIVIGRASGFNTEPTLDSIGQALATLLSEVVSTDQVLGLTWSRAIESMIPHLEYLASCEVVQLAGALTFTGDRLGSVEVIRQVARIADGTAHPLYAPLVVDDPRTASSLSRQPEIAANLELIDTLDIAVVSVGTWTPQGSALYPRIPRKLADMVTAAGACVEISGRVMDAHGVPVCKELDARIIGITTQQLHNVPHIIATSYGKQRATATIAAARGGLMNTLIADEALAHEILRELKETPKPRQSH